MSISMGCASTQTILVVEDEAMIRMLIAEILREQGYRVIEATNGDEGRDFLLSDQVVDLIVTDVRMPGEIDGVELTALSKQLAPARPVVVVSGHLSPGAVSNADEFLPKPYLASTFLNIVARLLSPQHPQTC